MPLSTPLFLTVTTLCFATLLSMPPSFGKEAAPPKPAAPKTGKPKPLLKEFIGLNVHTVQFKSEQYTPVTRLVRDYHPYNWDVGDDTNYAPPFPFARNQVNWETMYGGWLKNGYDINASLLLDNFEPKNWKNLAADAYAYGFTFSRFFGPSGARKLVNSIEIGNEPGIYSDEEYLTLFKNAAQGIRKADPKMKIVTCATDTTPSGKYHKGIHLFKGLESLYDVINVHSYAEAEPYPTWRRSYPEDPAIPYLKTIRNVIDWRDKNGPGKPIWLTEFGWDSTTQPQAKEGDFKNWVGVTDTQQAQYIVRSFLVFSAMDLDRAYLFWFNDDDLPQIHGSAGLMRKGVPKPSFHAVAHLQKTLGEYRFQRAVEEKVGDHYIYEFAHASDPKLRIWALWSPTGANRTTTYNLKGLPGKVTKAERMPLKVGEPEAVQLSGEGAAVEVGESPIYLTMRMP